MKGDAMGKVKGIEPDLDALKRRLAACMGCS